MSQLLSVSRAARLVGVSRGTLQKKIRKNELATFEGMIQVSDLLRAYPEAKLEDDSAFERVRRIKADASPSDREQTQLPPAAILAARLTRLSRELIEAKTELQRYANLTAQLEAKLQDLQQQEASEVLQAVQIWLREELAKRPKISPRNTELLVKDTFLRILSAAVKVIPSGKEFFVEGRHSLLEAALNAGLSMNYGCTNGHCGACKARIISGEALKIHDHSYELSATEQNLGYLLMCSYTAVTDMVIEAGEAQTAADIPLQKVTTSIKQLIRLRNDLMIVQLQTPKTQSLRFMAGQTATLTLAHNGETFSAQSPLASCPCDGRNLQFHIRQQANDGFSRILFEQSKIGDTLQLAGPSGNFCLHKEETAPLLFVAQGDAFAAIKSLIEQAVSADRTESIGLYWVSTEPSGHYMNNLCRSWSDALDNFAYMPLLSHTDEPDAAWAAQAIISDQADLSRRQVYVAGSASFMSQLHTLLTTQGLPASQYFMLN